MSICQYFVRYSYRGLVSFPKKFKNLFFSSYITKKNLETSMNSKPLNILVYTGKDCPKLFKNIEDGILKCVPSQNYLVYHLLPSEIKNQPWMETTSLLVLSSDQIDDSIAIILENYLKIRGKVFLVCSKFSTLAGFKCVALEDSIENPAIVSYGSEEIEIYRGNNIYISSDSTILCKDNQGRPVIHKTIFQNGISIVSEIYIDRDPEVSVSPKYDKKKRLLILKHVLTDGLSLIAQNKDTPIIKFSPGFFASDNETPKKYPNKSLIFRQCSVNFQDTEAKLEILYHTKSNTNSVSFDTDLYFSSLSTEAYGHNLVYFPIVTSTMDIAEQLSDYEDIVIVASAQVSGKGRGTNKWISPLGCAMFTLHFTIPIHSNLGKKLSLIQHIAALAIVHGIRRKEQYKDLNIRIKWPNDIYFDDVKIGGLIVTSKLQDKIAELNIGWGVNVTNSDPTVCICDAIKIHNEKTSHNLPYLHVEEVIAFTLSQMKYFINNFQNFGAETFFQHYYSYWMHGDQSVTLENLNEEGIIKGLDEYGYLIVKTVKGKEVCLQPDGNRFDITKNLIYLRN